MKIRMGFVSNSSTTSFCIYGVALNQGDYDYEDLEEMTPKEFTVQWGPDGYDANWVGRSWASVGDDETGAQFKASVEKVVKDLFGEEVKCSTHEEGWYDG